MTTKRTTLPSPDSASRISEIVFPGQLNHHGTYFGGAGLALMSRAAFVAASRAARADVVIAAVDQVEFRCPVLVGDLVEATARVERHGTRSMTVAVEVVAEVLRTGERRHALQGRFEMVAVDAAGSDVTAWPPTPSEVVEVAR